MRWNLPGGPRWRPPSAGTSLAAADGLLDRLVRRLVGGRGATTGLSGVAAAPHGQQRRDEERAEHDRGDRHVEERGHARREDDEDEQDADSKDAGRHAIGLPAGHGRKHKLRRRPGPSAGPDPAPPGHGSPLYFYVPGLRVVAWAA